MDPVNSLIALAAVAWTGHIALGWLQINRFNRALASLSDNGVVRIGRSDGHFKPRVVMAFTVNSDGRITSNFIMKGVTVFSRPYTEKTLSNLLLSEIRPEIIFPANKALQQALALALENKR